jgi:Intraflagellar transport complex B, subunit 20
MTIRLQNFITSVTCSTIYAYLAHEFDVFITDIDKYQKIAEDLVTTSETLSVQVEEEKIAALQANIKLQHEAEHRAILQHQLQVRPSQV